MNSPKTLQQAIQYFSDEQTCIDAVAAMRWPDGPRCPDCVRREALNPYYLKTQKRWKCRECRIQFSVKRGTIFEDSPISLTKWLPAMWLLVNCKNGISSYEISRDLGVTQKTAWFMLQRLRLVEVAGDHLLRHPAGDQENGAPARKQRNHGAGESGNCARVTCRRPDCLGRMSGPTRRSCHRLQRRSTAPLACV